MRSWIPVLRVVPHHLQRLLMLGLGMCQTVSRQHDKPPVTSADVNLPVYGRACHDRIFKDFSGIGDGFAGRGEKYFIET